ncbi:MAG: MATE family efflux transporter [Clostridiales bacterium]|nr:MATE family efflux transporter [Clostridiales bacterium]MDY3745559.1 MATE family efflux transporter [Lachnospiraceae bacterium]
MNHKINLSEGPVFGNLIRFSFPLIFTNVLQAIYNVADMSITGHFTNPESMTAVNTSGQITMIVLMIIVGFSNGTNIVTGQLVGVEKTNDIKDVVQTTLPLFGLLAVIISILLGILSTPLLHLLNMPLDAFLYAKKYLLICLIGTIFVYIYNTLAAILRGLGDSLRPMIFMVISTVTNIVLDFVFMGIFGLGVTGAAIATVIAQCLSMVLIIIYFIKTTNYLSFKVTEWKNHSQIIKMVLKIGLPQACQFSATQLSLLLIAAMVNNYGVVAAAAVGACNKAGSFAQLPGQALNCGVLTATAQNLPKRNYRRIIQSMFCAMGLGIAISSGFCFIAFLSPATILNLFTTNTDVISAGTFYLTLMSIGFIFENIIYATTGIVSGAGYTPITMIAAMLSAIGRVIFAVILQETTDLGLYAISIASIVAPMIPVIIMIIVLTSGKWKISRIQAEIHSLNK